jgi:hypothetical protein
MNLQEMLEDPLVNLDALVERIMRVPPKPPIQGGARQLLAEGPFTDPPVSAPLSADVATTAVDMWSGVRYTPIYGGDPKAGKVYIVEAGGFLSTGASGTLTISPFYGTNTGIALGASQAQTVVASLTNIPWFLKFVLIFRTIGAPGNNSGVTCNGLFNAPGAAGTAASNNTIAFGSTSTTSTNVDASVNKDITIQKTLSVAGSFSTNWVYLYSLN